VGHALPKVVLLAGQPGETQVSPWVRRITFDKASPLVFRFGKPTLPEQDIRQLQPRRVGIIATPLGRPLQFRDGLVRVTLVKDGSLVISPTRFPRIERFRLGEAGQGLIRKPVCQQDHRQASPGRRRTGRLRQPRARTRDQPQHGRIHAGLVKRGHFSNGDIRRAPL
jgi:hypothetical protein